MNVVDGTLLAKLIAEVSPEQSVCVLGVAVTTGIGFTTTETTAALLVQPFKVTET